MAQKRYAYLIGANGPQGQPHIVEALKYAEKDVERLEVALKADPCVFTEVHSIVARSPGPVLEGLETLARKCEKSDLLVVHFSGHGLVERSLYLICNGTNVEEKRFNSGAIKIDQVKDILHDCSARHKLLILDCCQAAAANSGGTWKGIPDLENALGDLKGNANIILSACAPNKKARELDTLELSDQQGAGFLSWAITRACSQDFAEASHDQALSLHDIWHWVKKVHEKVNQSLPPTEQLPLPRLFEEREGQDDEIWFTPRRHKATENRNDELKQREELATHEQEEFLRQYCFGATAEDFDHTKVWEYAQNQYDYDKLPTNNIVELCQKLGLTSGTGMPRREAVLAFHAIPSRYLPSAFIRVFARSSSSDEYISSNIEGSLADQAKKAEIWLLNRLEKIAANIGHGERTERWEIPERALRELIVNAIVHRDYQANENIHIRITPKQVIITNPGLLDPAIIACNPPFAYGESHPRNSRLLSILTTQRWAEGNALGFEIVREEFEKYGLPLPEISNHPGGLVKVVIQRPNLSAISRNEAITNTFLNIWNVPYGQNPFFIGREPLLIQLEALLLSDHHVVLSQPEAISEIGGVGKTQTAVEYAYRHRAKYQVVFWIEGETYESLLNGFIALAKHLKLQKNDDQDQTRIVKAAHQWLNTHASWLLIIDNINDLAMTSAFLPASIDGHILLITRAVSTRNPVRTIEIDALEEEQSAFFLLRRAGFLKLDAPPNQVSFDEITMARELSKELDGLPLALDLAGAYIEETGISLADYIRLYRQYQVSLLQQRENTAVSYSKSVATAWLLTFSKIEQMNPAASEILHLCAFLQPDAIPEEFLLNSIEQLTPIVADSHALLSQTITILQAYALIHHNVTEHTLSLHRLVQVILRDTMGEQEIRQWAERAIRTVNNIFPDVSVETWPQCQRYLLQVIACSELMEEYNLFFPEAARLLDQAAVFELDHALYSKAESLSQQALHIRDKLSSSDHPDTAQRLNNLGFLYYNQGRYEEAEAYYKRSLEVQNQTTDLKHPYTAQILNNLALLYQNQKRYEEAKVYYKQAIAIFEVTKGSDHLDTAQILNDLALLYYNLGQYGDSETLFQRVLAIREQALGPDHSDTTISLNNLASLYCYQRRFQEAKPLYQRALTISKQVFGSEHPYTLAISRNYTALQQQTDDSVVDTQLEEET